MNALRRLFLLGFSSVLALLSAGCVTQRTDVVPQTSAPNAWRAQFDGIAPVEEKWWLVFDDSRLNGLIESAQLQNLDVAAATQRVAQARAALQMTSGQELPRLDLTAGLQRSDVGSIGGSANLGAGYTLDLWSAAKARTQGAQSQLEAVEAGRAVTLWRLSTAVAQLYYQRRSLDELLEIAYESLATAERTYERVQARHQSGLISALDLALAKTAVESERGTLATVKSARDRAHNAMALLLGRAPSQLAASEIDPQPLLDVSLPALPRALPAETIARRPDLHVVEAQLRAADANIVVARASLFPQLGIDAGGVLVRGAPDAAFSLGTNLVQAVFDGGQRRAGVRLAEAQYEELLENYRGAILKALSEIEDGLAQVKELAETEEVNRAVLESARHAHELSQARYDSGLVDALTLLSAQSTYLRARESLVRTRSAHLQALAGLHAGI